MAAAGAGLLLGAHALSLRDLRVWWQAANPPCPLTLLKVQSIQAVGQSRVVLDGITIAHRRSSQNLVRLCMDISNLDACYLIGNYPVVLHWGPGGGSNTGGMPSLGAVQFTGIAGTKDNRNLRVGAALCVRAPHSTFL